MTHKFKAGDKVCVVPSPIAEHNCSERSAKWLGLEAVVQDPPYHRHWLRVTWTTSTPRGNGGYYEDCFELVKPPAPAPALDLTKPLQTKDGRPVRIIGRMNVGQVSHGDIVGVIVNGPVAGKPDPEKPEALYSWNQNGKAVFPGCDLMNAPAEPISVVRVFRLLASKGVSPLPHQVQTVAEAKAYDAKKTPKMEGKPVLGYTVVTITEGDGLGDVSKHKTGCTCGCGKDCT
jgi:hypothetical protein